MAAKVKQAAAAAEVAEATVAQAAATTEAAREAATGGKNAAAVSMEAITAAFAKIHDVRDKFDIAVLTAMLSPPEEDANDACASVSVF